jgi:hypothetical protein
MRFGCRVVVLRAFWMWSSYDTSAACELQSVSLPCSSAGQHSRSIDGEGDRPGEEALEGLRFGEESSACNQTLTRGRSGICCTHEAID